MKTNRALGNFQTNCRTLTGRTPLLRLFRIAVATLAGIELRTMFRNRSLALAFQLLCRTETQISLAGLEQLIGVAAIDVHPVALPIRRERAAHVGTLLPIEAQPAQVFHQLNFMPLLTALDVGVFNAKDVHALFLPGK